MIVPPQRMDTAVAKKTTIDAVRETYITAWEEAIGDCFKRDMITTLLAHKPAGFQSEEQVEDYYEAYQTRPREKVA